MSRCLQRLIFDRPSWDRSSMTASLLAGVVPSDEETQSNEEGLLTRHQRRHDRLGAGTVPFGVADQAGDFLAFRVQDHRYR